MLITGASSGIGLELARLFARDGYGLVLVAREKSALHKVGEEIGRIGGSSPKIISKDLSRPGAAEEIFDEIVRESIDVDILVNNAGVGMYGPFACLEPGAALTMMRVNMESLTHLTAMFVKGMLARGEGRILNVASTAAFQPGPLMAVYSATKAYVLSLSEALSNELRGSGVSSTVLCPGPTNSQFEKRSGMTGTRIFNLEVMDAHEVAAIGYRGLMEGRTIVIPGLINRLLAYSVRLVTRRFACRLAGYIFDRPSVSNRGGSRSYSSAFCQSSNIDFRNDLAIVKARRVERSKRLEDAHPSSQGLDRES